jgi:nickel/cobalt exporter
MNKFLFFTIVFLSLSIMGFSQDNPFFSESTPPKDEQAAAVAAPGFFQSLLRGINNLQRELNASLSELSRKINQKKDVGLFFLLLGIAFFYGLVHALGPGHGKIIMVSYTLSNPMKTKHGIWLGAFIAAIHTLSAILFISVLYFILNSAYSHYAQESKKIISLISCGLITVMGLFLLLKTIFIDMLKLKKGNNWTLKVASKQNRIRDLLLPALFIGIVPCDGAIILLTFSIFINAYWLGIILALVMSLGMAMTISAIGIIAIYSKQGTLKLLSARRGTVKIVSISIQTAGATAILCFGLLLFCSRLL